MLTYSMFGVCVFVCYCTLLKFMNWKLTISCFLLFIFLLNLFLALLGGGKGLRMDHEALSWRAIKTKNQQAAVMCKSVKLFQICFCRPPPANYPLFW